LQKNWVNILFLSLTPVIGVLGTAAYAIAWALIARRSQLHRN
jgi:phage shock protein PspC (stress-responsive transcriptional regulator)